MSEKKEERKIKKGPVVGGVCAKRRGVMRVQLVVFGGQAAGPWLPFLADQGEVRRQPVEHDTMTGLDLLRTRPVSILLTSLQQCTLVHGCALRRALYNESKRSRGKIFSQV